MADRGEVPTLSEQEIEMIAAQRRARTETPRPNPERDAALAKWSGGM